MERRYNALGFIVVAAFALLIGWMLLSIDSTEGSLPGGTMPVTREGAQN